MATTLNTSLSLGGEKKPYINTILQDGGKNSPAIEICSYLNDTRLSHVSRVFRRANLCAMTEVGRRIGLSHPVKMEARAKDAAQILQGRPVEEFEGELFETVSRGMESFFSQATGNLAPYAVQLKGDWDALLLHRSRLFEEPPSKRTEDRLNLIVTGLSPVKEVVEEIPALDSDKAQEISESIALPIKTLIRLDRVERRFTAALQGRDFLLPENSPSILAAFHASQKQDALLHAEPRARFSEHSLRHNYSFNTDRFYLGEDILMRSELLRSHALFKLWGAVRGQIHAGPAADAPIETIRTWMNDDANAETLQQVEEIELPGHMGIPPEIGRLRGLSSLTCSDGDMTTLPDELALLPGLHELILRNQEFTEIPEVVERIPNLTRFDFAGNEEIHRIDAQWAERFNTHWYFENLDTSVRHAWALTTLFGLAHDSRHINRYGNLPEEQLTEIPFSFWFRERFMIPNLPATLVTAINVLLNNLLLEHILPLAVISVEVVVFAILSVVIGTPILALNAILCHVIEPIVIAIRKACGYSGMVQLR